MTYDDTVRALAQQIDARCDAALNIVVIDGIPAGGKSSLAAAIERELEQLGRGSVTVENDWFIARAIRNPVAIVYGLAIALSPRSLDELEARLLARFLDDARLHAFQTQLEAARRTLALETEAVLRPEGALWNLHDPRPWPTVAASKGLVVRRGDVVLIEGTLSAAAYAKRFPDLTRVLVLVPPDVARRRFLARNQDPTRRRNLAFSALARNSRAFEIASRLILRHRDRFDFEIDLEHVGR